MGIWGNKEDNGESQLVSVQVAEWISLADCWKLSTSTCDKGNGSISFYGVAIKLLLDLLT